MAIKHIVPLVFLAACGENVVRGGNEMSAPAVSPSSDVIAELPTATYRAAFYAGRDLDGAPLYEHDTAAIDYTWGAGGPGCGVPADDFSARWTGQLRVEGGWYRVETYSDDGIRVFVDGEPVIDFWNDHPATAMANTVALERGAHEVIVEYYDHGGEAVAKVAWAQADGDVPSSDTDPDLAAAQAFVADLTLGVNIERGWAWEVGGDYFRYLREELGATHVRLFYPWRPWVDMGGGGPGNSAPDAERFGRILDATREAVDAGLKVFLDCSDVIDVDEAVDVRDHVRRCAQWIAARGFDPAKVAVGPINEHAGSDNATWNGIRVELHRVMRDALPGYVLTTGAAGWKSRPDLLRDDFATFEDRRVIYEWHHYDSSDAGEWQARAAELAQWRATHDNRPTVCGECGAGYWDESIDGTPLATAPWAWPQRFAEQLPAVASERPMLWAVTYGSSYRLNVSGNDPRLTTELADSFRANERTIRAELSRR